MDFASLTGPFIHCLSIAQCDAMKTILIYARVMGLGYVNRMAERSFGKYRIRP